MTRSEAIAQVALSDLAILLAEERAATLATMHGEAWHTEPGWSALPSELRDELTIGPLKTDPLSSRYDPALLLYIARGYRGATNDYLTHRLSQLGVGSVSITGEAVPMEACPCCGCKTLDSRGQFDICVVCWWEDDGQDNESADRTLGGPNDDLCLSKARANFLVHGIYDPTREDLRPFQEPAEKFARGRHFALVDNDSAVEEPLIGWRSRPLGLLQRTSAAPRTDA